MLIGLMHVPASQTKSRRRAGSLLACCLQALVISSLLAGTPWLPSRDAASAERAELYAGRAEPGFEKADLGFEQADPFEARYRCWLEDPRAPSETPAEIEPGTGRRWSWRSQRRATRRRLAAERALPAEPDGEVTLQTGEHTLVVQFDGASACDRCADYSVDGAFAGRACGS